MMQLTDEQLRALMEMQMSDVGGMEEDQARMNALATGLRGHMGQIQGKDWGSNLGRAGYGIAGAIGDYKTKGLTPDIEKAKKNTFRSIIQGLTKGKTADYPMANNPDEDPSLYQGF